jgi:hypothetical protein
MRIPNIQSVVEEANKIMKLQVAPYIEDRVNELKPWIENKIREMVKEECLKQAANTINYTTEVKPDEPVI